MKPCSSSLFNRYFHVGVKTQSLTIQVFDLKPINKFKVFEVIISVKFGHERVFQRFLHVGFVRRNKCMALHPRKRLKRHKKSPIEHSKLLHNYTQLIVHKSSCRIFTNGLKNKRFSEHNIYNSS